MLAVALTAIIGCNRASRPDKPQLAPNTRLEDIRFHSAALDKDITYRVIASTQPHSTPIPVVFLLHGSGDDYTSWSNHSAIADLAAHDVLLVMPDAQGAFYVNQSGGKRYEDYLIDELIPNFRQHFPTAAKDGSHTAIVGISRGGFSAVTLGLQHPKMFSNVAALSPALDFAERSFRWQQPGLSMQLRHTFGSRGSDHRRQNDPFVLLQNVDDDQVFYIACGTGDSLIGTNRRFVDLLKKQHMSMIYSFPNGGHDWTFWNAQLPDLERYLLSQLQSRQPLSSRDLPKP